MVKIFIDSNMDFTKKQCEEYGIEMIKMPYYVGEKQVLPWVDYDEYDSKAFYDMLRGGTIPKTNAIGPLEYASYFEPWFEKGYDIVYVHFSEATSGTFQSMRLGLEELLEKYPERKFYEADTLMVTAGAYEMMRDLLDHFKEPYNAEEIVKWVEEERQHYAMYFFPENLNFFAKTGRISNFKSIMGNLIGIKPIIYLSPEGEMTDIGKARGKKSAIETLVNKVEEIGDDIKNHRFVIGHTDALETAQDLGAAMKAKFGEDLNIEYVVVNPTMGSHCGPGGVGVCFHSTRR